MGAWRRVQIVGTCDRAEARKLRELIEADVVSPDYDYDNFGPLCAVQRMLGALPVWPSSDINVTGSLAERGYGIDSVQEHLEKLVETAPSLTLRVHLSKENSKECEGTLLLKEGNVFQVDPEIETVPDILEY